MNTKIDILNMVRRFSKELPHFPDGRIDFTSSKAATVVNVYVFYRNELLLLHRSDKVRTYKGMWDVVGGYLDEIKSPVDKAREELQEELSISQDAIESIELIDITERHDKEIDIIWIIGLVLVKLKRKPDIKLDWEHTGYAWIDPKDIGQYPHISSLEDAIAKLVNY